MGGQGKSDCRGHDENDSASLEHKQYELKQQRWQQGRYCLDEDLYLGYAKRIGYTFNYRWIIYTRWVGRYYCIECLSGSFLIGRLQRHVYIAFGVAMRIRCYPTFLIFCSLIKSILYVPRLLQIPRYKDNCLCMVVPRSPWGRNFALNKPIFAIPTGMAREVNSGSFSIAAYVEQGTVYRLRSLNQFKRGTIEIHYQEEEESNRDLQHRFHRIKTAHLERRLITQNKQASFCQQNWVSLPPYNVRRQLFRAPHRVVYPAPGGLAESCIQNIVWNSVLVAFWSSSVEISSTEQDATFSRLICSKPLLTSISSFKTSFYGAASGQCCRDSAQVVV